MVLRERKSFLVFGMLFGAWLGLTYAFVTQAINWIFMPGIPFVPQDASLQDFLLQYFLMGAFLGVITALPENRFVGMALGGFAMGIGTVIAVIAQQWGQDGLFSSILLLVIGFLPLSILLMSLSLVVRLGIDSQQTDPDRPHLWARRFIIPVILTLLAVGVGSFSLIKQRERNAFYYMDDMIKQGMQANSYEALPDPLKDVSGFLENAQGNYTLAWSDRIYTFFGPRPAGDELSQFLIIARFENQFAMACIFSPSRMVPNCTNY